MARYRAKCWFGSNVGMQEMEVSSSSSYGAVEMLKNVYGAQQVYNIHEVRGNNNSSSSSSLSGAGGLGLLVLIGAVMFAPWVLMTVGGAVGTWISEKVVGYSLEESVDNEDMPRVLIILFAAILSGGIGFYQGTEFQKYINTPDTPAQQQQIKK